MNKFKDPEETIDTFFKTYKKLPQELQEVGDNMEFEKDVEEHPIPDGIGKTKVFGCETWDINSILKGNYWRRTIYTTDKLCKLFLKADLNQKKKYLRKKNPTNFNFFWIMIIMFGVVVAIMVIMFLLPRLGGVVP
jgi:hypothetical protein